MPRITGTFEATGQSAELKVSSANYTLSLSGGATATVKLQRSFDDGVTWKDVKSYTADAEENGFEPTSKVSYRLNCSAYTSGTVTYVFGTADSGYE